MSKIFIKAIAKDKNQTIGHMGGGFQRGKKNII
jgi:hypothetical protein